MPDPAEGLGQPRPNRPEPARVISYEMDDNSEESAGAESPSAPAAEFELVPVGIKGYAKHTVGLLLLGCVVFLWTACNFLGSSIFADNTYAKPFFLTYLNTSTFLLAMVPNLVSSAWNLHRRREWQSQLAWTRDRYHRGGWKLLLAEDDSDEKDDSEGQSLMTNTDEDSDSDIRISNSTLPNPTHRPVSQRSHLALFPTAWLSFKFCILWFIANYLALACLQHTSVASTTILTSTSSVWTLFIGAITGIEKFTIRKFLGVTASIFGIILISRVDLGFNGRDINFTNNPSAPPSNLPQGTSASSIIPRYDSFPEKPAREIALGDILALLSAMLYGFYTIMLKKVTLSCLPLKINMPLFFGLVGFFNLILLWPFLIILHFTTIEPFQLPPTSRIWVILLINSVSSLASDICWAYAMILTSPLVVTVGLSLTIPLSLVGEMVIQGRFESVVYWVGSLFVVGSFVFVDKEEAKEAPELSAQMFLLQQQEQQRRGRYGETVERTKWERFKGLFI